MMVAQDGSVPKTGQGKAVAFNDKRHKMVQRGAEKIELEDHAMWTALTGNVRRSNPMKMSGDRTQCFLTPPAPEDG